MLAYGMSIHKCRGPNGWLDFVPYNFDNDILEAAFAQIVPSRSPITLRSRQFSNLSDLKTEEWTKQQYNVVDNDNLYVMGKSSWPEEFSLPAPNKFVVTGLKIKDDESREWAHPKRIVRKSNGELWFK